MAFQCRFTPTIIPIVVADFDKQPAGANTKILDGLDFRHGGNELTARLGNSSTIAFRKEEGEDKPKVEARHIANGESLDMQERRAER